MTKQYRIYDQLREMTDEQHEDLLEALLSEMAESSAFNRVIDWLRQSDAIREEAIACLELDEEGWG